MPTIQISDRGKDIIKRLVADRAAASEADVVENALLRQAEALDDDHDATIAAAREGIEAIQRGDYTTVASAEDQDALLRRIWSRAMVWAEEAQPADVSASHGS